MTAREQDVGGVDPDDGDGDGAPGRAADPPHMFDELAERGLTLLEEGGDQDEAQAALERALAIRNDDPDVAYGLGVIYGLKALKNWTKMPRALLRDNTPTESMIARAILCYQRTVELDPSRAAAWTNLATLYALKGDRDLAIDSLKRSLHAAPDQPAVRERLEELGAF